VSDEQEKPFQMPDTTATEKAPDVSHASLSLLDVAFEFEPGKWTLAEIMHKLDCIDGVLKCKANGWTWHDRKAGT
jgi:hypothetical protein